MTELAAQIGRADQECGVRDHLRPPERRPRSFSMRPSFSRSTLRGGSFSSRSSNSPQVLAGRWMLRRTTWLKESWGCREALKIIARADYIFRVGLFIHQVHIALSRPIPEIKSGGSAANRKAIVGNDF